jgi:hypothetical protein
MDFLGRLKRNLLRRILTPLAILLIGLISELSSQEVREYKITDKAYGIAWDGTYLYYLDSGRRALIRFDEQGRQEIFNLGLPNMRGISFDTKEGRLLVTAPKMVLKIDPNTGGITERVPIPLPQLSGIIAVDSLYYLLDLESGRVHYYDRATGLLAGGFITDRPSPKDIAYGKNSIWVSDSSNGSIYRYNPDTGRITGSIQAPASDIRGILFSGAKLWVVDRTSKEIRNVAYLETDRFISSGESEYQVRIKFNYNLPEVPLQNAEIAIIQPPNNENQRVRNVETKEKGFRNGAVDRARSLNKKLNVDSPRGNQTTSLQFQAIVSNTVYYVDEPFLKKREAVPAELDSFRDPKGENFHISPRDQLILFNSILSGESNFKNLDKKLRKNGFPSQPGKAISIQKKTGIIQEMEYLNAYLPGFGWIPYSEKSAKPQKENQLYEAKDNEIVIFQTQDGKELRSPVFFRQSPKDPWVNLEAKWEISVQSERK